MKEHIWRVGLLAVCALFLGMGGDDSAGGQEVAVQQEPKSTPEALAVYGDAANFQNNGAFEIAETEWLKFLKNFPDDPLAGKAQHYLGICSLKLKKFEAAAAAFQKVVNGYPAFELTEEAYLNLGWCQYTLGQANDKNSAQLAKAKDTFARMLKLYPPGKGTKCDQALFFQAETLYGLNDKEAAVRSYSTLLKGFSESSLSRDALYALGVTQEELGRYAKAGDAYQKFMGQYADHELFSEVQMRHAETLLQQGVLAQQGGDAELAGSLFKRAEAEFEKVARIKEFSSTDHALYRQAFCVIQRNDLTRAATIYEQIVGGFPDSQYVAQATLGAGRCYYRVEQLDQAREAFQRLWEQGNQEASEAAHWLCQIHLRQGEFAAAAKLAGDAIKTAGESAFLVRLKMDYADALFEQADHRVLALKQYAAIVETHPEDASAPQANYNAAFAALDLADYQRLAELVKVFRARYAEHVLFPDVLYVEAEAQLQQQEYAAAETMFGMLLRKYAKHVDRADWMVRLGVCQYGRENYEAVIAGLSDSIASLPKKEQRAESHFLIGASQFFLKQFAAAQGSLKASVEVSPNWRRADETLLFLARTERRMDNLDMARQTVHGMLKAFPESSLRDQAHYRLGEFEYAAGDFGAAVKNYTDVIKNWPESEFTPFAIYGRGWAQLQAGDFKAAVASFGNLLEQHPKHSLMADSLLARAIALRRETEYESALRDLDQFLTLAPQTDQRVNALYERGLVEVALKKHGVAEQTFGELLKLDPKYSAADRVLYELAWAQKSQEKIEDSLSSFRKLVEAYPQSSMAAESHFHLAEANYEKKSYKLAIDSYLAAKKSQADEELAEQVAYKIGWSHFKLDDFESARQQFRTQIDSGRDTPLVAEARFMEAECFFKQQQYDQALPLFESAVKAIEARRDQISDVIQVLVRLHAGQTAIRLKQTDRAVELLSPVLERFPKSPYLAEARFERGKARNGLGQTAAAIADFEQATRESRSVVGAQARFWLGEIQFKMKKYELAIKHYQRVMFGYGGEKAPPEIKEVQATAGYECARCAEVQIKGEKNAARKAKLLADAKRWYQYVVAGHTDSRWAAEAEKRLAVLAKL